MEKQFEQHIKSTQTGKVYIVRWSFFHDLVSISRKSSTNFETPKEKSLSTEPSTSFTSLSDILNERERERITDGA